MRAHGRPSAVSIGLGADGHIVVDLVEQDPTMTIGHVLLARQAKPSPSETLFTSSDSPSLPTEDVHAA